MSKKFRNQMPTLGGASTKTGGSVRLWRDWYRYEIPALEFLSKKESKTDQLLHKAASSGDAALLKKVLDSGKVHVDCCDEEGTTALMLAAANDHIECVKLLIEDGAEVCAQRQRISRHDLGLLECASVLHKFLSIPDLSGTHALFFAAQGGHLELLRYLIEIGSNVNLGSKDGGTPLFVAAQCGHLDIVEELVKNGAELDSEMSDGAAPLFIASQNGYTAVVRYLLSKGACVDRKRTDGATPLWIASQMGHAAVVKELLRNGADANCAREDGATPLFKAAHKGHIGVVEELLERRPNLGILANGESALHAASLFGHLSAVKLLVQAGSNPALKNKSGEMPMDLAQQMGYDQIVDYLRNFTGPKQPILHNGLGLRSQKCTDV